MLASTKLQIIIFHQPLRSSISHCNVQCQVFTLLEVERTTKERIFLVGFSFSTSYFPVVYDVEDTFQKFFKEMIPSHFSSKIYFYISCTNPREVVISCFHSATREVTYCLVFHNGHSSELKPFFPYIWFFYNTIL